MDMQLMLNLLFSVYNLRKRDLWSRTQLETHQAAALRRLRDHAYANSRFYQKFHRGLTNAPLSELPVLSKGMLMEHFDELVTDPDIRVDEIRSHVASAPPGSLYLERYWINTTSGSTGRPGLFLFNRAEWTAVLTSFARAHEWAGLKVSLTHQMKMASVASSNPWHMSAQVGASLRSRWMPALRLDASEPLDDIVHKLNAWQPEMLVAYAAMARSLADEQIAGRLRISPHLIFTSSEVLTQEARRQVAAAWGREPFDQYGATETADLAAECAACRRMHLYEDLVIIEVVDEHNRPAPPGVYGDKVLATVLFNRTQPLIRYELSDSVRLTATECPSGRPFRTIDGVQGRREDVLHFVGATGGRVAVHPNTFHHIMDVVPASGWQVQQTPEGLTLLLSGSADDLDTHALSRKIASAVADQGAAPPSVQVKRIQSIPKTASGKTPLIQAMPSVSASGTHAAASVIHNVHAGGT